MKKRVISIITALAMTVTMTSVNMSVVNAKADPAKTLTGKQVAAAAGVGYEPGKSKNANKKPEYVEHQAIVMFSSDSEITKKKALSTLSGTADDLVIKKVWNFDEETTTPLHTFSQILSVPSKTKYMNVALVNSKSMSTEKLVKTLKSKKGVKYAEPNFKIHVTSDNMSSYQWALKNTGQNGGTSGASINIDSKWSKGTEGSKDVVVAVVDTGIDYTHPDLKANIWNNPKNIPVQGKHGYDFINADEDPMDDNGHGTHCAGIIGANGNIFGVNKNVSLMACKILDSNGSSEVSYEVDAYNYINKALESGVNIKAINNSWGGGYSEIFGELIDLVGSKGAVTVCAAGNDGLDLSDEGTYEFYEAFGMAYPANLESEYKIVVAASNEDNELADFSNYGKNLVDVAAPGADILSTVSYPCYNPTIYSDSKIDETSLYFENYNGSDPELVPVSSESSTEGAAEATTDDNIYFGTEGKALRIEFKGMKQGEARCVKIPYTLPESTDEKKAGYAGDGHRLSAMVKLESTSSDESESAGFIVDGPANYVFDSNNPLELTDTNDYGGSYYNFQNIWHHFDLTVGASEMKVNRERAVYAIVTAEQDADYSIIIDDLGVSRDTFDADSDIDLLQYDFYNGTSMATPAVTGAVALLASEDKNLKADDLVIETLSHVKQTSKIGDKVATGGVLDFSQSGISVPRISGVEVSAGSNGSQINIKGRNFEGAESVKLTINGKTTEVKPTVAAKNGVVIDGKGLINNVADIEVVTPRGVADKKNVYLVKGKKEYSDSVWTGAFVEWGGATSDAQRVYVTDLSDSSIQYANRADENPTFTPIETLNAKALFGDDDENARVNIISDPVVIGDKLYVLAAEGLGTDVPQISDDDWFFTMSSRMYIVNEYGLIEMDLNKIENDGYDDDSYSDEPVFDDTPETIGTKIDVDSYLKQCVDVTLASYNGLLYFIGGYDKKTEKPSTKVITYNPATKKWGIGPSLPSGRAGGKAIQTDSGLVYTMGYGEDQVGKSVKTDERGYEDYSDFKCPKNLVFNGKEWKESTKTLTPYIAGAFISRDDNYYVLYTADIGVTKGGIVYMGVPCQGLGDTFIYKAAEDKFVYTLYNEITNLTGVEAFHGFALDGKAFGMNNNGEWKSFPITSGYVSVKDNSGANGKISGANKKVLPGTKVVLKPVPNKNCYTIAKSFKVDGQVVNGTSKTVYVGKNGRTATAKFGKYVTKIKLNKTAVKLDAGKKITLKATVTPKDANNKAVTWKSSNTKYATVNANGVVTAKRAGKGKTVTITCQAKDKKGVKATCKITINQYVTKIKLNKKKATIKVGKSLKLKATILPKNATNKAVTWKSSNTKYATVTANGVVTVKKAGKGKTVKITCTAKDKKHKKATCKVKIK